MEETKTDELKRKIAKRLSTVTDEFALYFIYGVINGFLNAREE